MKSVLLIVSAVMVLALGFPTDSRAAFDLSLRLAAEVVDGDTLINIKGNASANTAVRIRVYDQDGVKRCDQNFLLDAGTTGTENFVAEVNSDLCNPGTPLSGPGALLLDNISGNGNLIFGDYIRFFPGIGRFGMSAFQGGVVWTDYSFVEIDVTSIPGFTLIVECNAPKLQQATDQGISGPASATFFFFSFDGLGQGSTLQTLPSVYRRNLADVNATFAAAGGALRIGPAAPQFSCLHWVGPFGKKMQNP